eukprot:4427175-Prymnesium_polylepis.1
MIAPKGANLEKLDLTWGGAKKMMSNVAKFLETLQNFDKDNFLLENKAKVLEYTGTTSSGLTEPSNPELCVGAGARTATTGGGGAKRPTERLSARLATCLDGPWEDLRLPPVRDRRS